MKRNRILSVLLTLVMVMSVVVLPVRAEELFSGGDGTNASPYLISTYQDLVDLATYTNSGKTTSGKYFELTNDIYANNISNYENWGTTPPKNKFTPIGQDGIAFNSAARPFKGSFNGKGYIIYGLYIKSEQSDQNSGLFACISGATVENVTIKNSYIIGDDCVGGVIGSVFGKEGKETNVSRCNSVNSYIMGDRTVGGVIGWAHVSNNENGVAITECVNTSRVAGSGSVGGICGESKVYKPDTNTFIKIKKCSNLGDISAEKREAGGIAGTFCDYDGAGGLSVYADECYNVGTIKSDFMVGGIAGYFGFGYMSNCYNSGEIVGNEDVGGIVGYNSQDWFGIRNPEGVNHCYNVGVVRGEASIGGIVGKSYMGILNCYYLDTCIGEASSVRGTALTFEQMHETELYKGFNFDNIWEMGRDSKYEFPTLKSNLHQAVSWTPIDPINNGRNDVYTPYYVTLTPHKMILTGNDYEMPLIPSTRDDEYSRELYEWAKEFGYEDIITQEVATEIIDKYMPTTYRADSTYVKEDNYDTKSVMRDIIMLNSTKWSIYNWEDYWTNSSEQISATDVSERGLKILEGYSDYCDSADRNPIANAFCTVASTVCSQGEGYVKGKLKTAAYDFADYLAAEDSAGFVEKFWSDSKLLYYVYADSTLSLDSDTYKDLAAFSAIDFAVSISKSQFGDFVEEAAQSSDTTGQLYDMYTNLKSIGGFVGDGLSTAIAPYKLAYELLDYTVNKGKDVNKAFAFLTQYYFINNYPELCDILYEEDGNLTKNVINLKMQVLPELDDDDYIGEALVHRLIDFEGIHNSVLFAIDDEEVFAMTQSAVTMNLIDGVNVNSLRRNIVEYWVGEYSGESVTKTQIYIPSGASCVISSASDNSLVGTLESNGEFFATAENVRVVGKTDDTIVIELTEGYNISVNDTTENIIINQTNTNNDVVSSIYAPTENMNISTSGDTITVTSTNENEEAQIEEPIAVMNETMNKLLADANSVEIIYEVGDWAEHVEGDLELRTTGSYGSTISWNSSHPDIVSNTGIVDKPFIKQEVVLTAQITLNSKTVTKTFSITVMPEIVEEDFVTYADTGYYSENAESTDKIGEIVFNSQFKKYNDYIEIQQGEKIIWDDFSEDGNCSGVGGKDLSDKVYSVDVNSTYRPNVFCEVQNVNSPTLTYTSEIYLSEGATAVFSAWNTDVEAIRVMFRLKDGTIAVSNDWTFAEIEGATYKENAWNTLSMVRDRENACFKLYVNDTFIASLEASELEEGVFSKDFGFYFMGSPNGPIYIDNFGMYVGEYIVKDDSYIEKDDSESENKEYRCYNFTDESDLTDFAGAFGKITRVEGFAGKDASDMVAYISGGNTGLYNFDQYYSDDIIIAEAEVLVPEGGMIDIYAGSNRNGEDRPCVRVKDGKVIYVNCNGWTSREIITDVNTAIWHKVAIEMNKTDGTAKVYFDDDLIHTEIDVNYYLGGITQDIRIQGNGYFDNFRVYSTPNIGAQIILANITHQVINTEDVSKDIVSDDEFVTSPGKISQYGMYIYRSGNDNNRITLFGKSMVELQNNKGSFFGVLEDIPVSAFNEDIIAVPFVVIDGIIIEGTPYPYKVSNSLKWLGEKTE